MMAKILAIILNFNRSDLTESCIVSLRKQNAGVDLIVIDNASTDSSPRLLIDFLRGPQERLMTLSTAVGFAAGVNCGLKVAIDENYEFALLLGNDTILDNCEVVSALMGTCRSDSSIAAVGGLQVFAKDPNTIYSAGGTVNRRAWVTDHSERGLALTNYQDRISKVTTVDYIDFAAVALSVAAVKDVGYLNENYQFYWEDVDWCLRAENLGYQLKVRHDAVVRHYGSASTGLWNSQKTYWLERNRFESALKFRSKPFLVSLWGHEIVNLMFNKRFKMRKISFYALVDFALRRPYRTF